MRAEMNGMSETRGIESEQFVSGPAMGETGKVNIDIAAMSWIKDRLSLDDFGRLSVQIVRAASAKRPSELQRLLLALVVHSGEVASD